MRLWTLKSHLTSWTGQWFPVITQFLNGSQKMKKSHNLPFYNWKGRSSTELRLLLTYDFFLAPTGAQEVTLSVCPSVCLSVCLSGTSLSRAVNLHLSRSESSQSIKIRVIQSEPISTLSCFLYFTYSLHYRCHNSICNSQILKLLQY